MESQNKTKNMVQSVISGIGVVSFYLLPGTVLDYVLTQILSQYFIADCSEDCYFSYFNAIFMVVAFLSLVGGIRAGLRTHKRLSAKQYPTQTFS
jgi:hypothetical protein